jgi:4-hydroxy-tetrahydrodipicolinate reductase
MRSKTPNYADMGGGIPVFLSGLPGRMATLIAEALAKDRQFNLLPVGMTSMAHSGMSVRIGKQKIQLFTDFPSAIPPGTINIDYTIPQSAESNAVTYTRNRIPFVMGTTGGDIEVIGNLVRNSEISAVIAPNMAASVIKVQNNFDQLLKNSPDYFRGWHMRIRESHQASKGDVSGTALAFQAQLKRLGAVVGGEIESIRDPEIQKQLGIKNIDGHAYHWIRLVSPNGEKKEFRTAIEGRQQYVEGTLMAVRFLDQKVKEGSQGEVFTMTDVVGDDLLI